jgi:hypothetical protein
VISALFFLVARVDANPITAIFDSSGFLSAIFFDESSLTNADRGPGPGFALFDIFVVTPSIPGHERDGQYLTVLENDGGVSDIIRIRHPAQHFPTGTEATMQFLTTATGIDSFHDPFGGFAFASILETPGWHDLTGTFNTPFQIWFRSVPEPSTALLLLVGFMGIALTTLARRGAARRAPCMEGCETARRGGVPARGSIYERGSIMGNKRMRAVLSSVFLVIILAARVADVCATVILD